MAMQDELKNAEYKTGKDTGRFDNTATAEVSRLKNDAQDLAKDSKDLADKSAHATANYFHDLTQNIKKTSLATIRKTEMHIQEKPGQSVAIAFATGVIASILLGRKGG